MGGGHHPELSQGMVGGGLPHHLLRVMTTCQTLVTGKDWGAAGSGAHRTNIPRNRLQAGGWILLARGLPAPPQM